MSLSSKKELLEAIFFAKEKPELLFDILFDKVKDTPKLSSISISGDTSINIPTSDSATTTAPTVTGLDQYGDAISVSGTTFALKEEATGCSVDSSTGVLTVTTTAEEGEVIIVATNTSLTAELKVTIEPAEVEE